MRETVRHHEACRTVITSDGNFTYGYVFLDALLLIIAIKYIDTLYLEDN